MSKKVFSFRNLHELYTSNPSALAVKPRRRSYLMANDAVYDFAVGHEFVVIDTNSPFAGCIVSCQDADTLKRYGYDKVAIEFNSDRSIEVAL